MTRLVLLLFLGFLLAPLARAASFNTVVIDAGHGGFDRGGIPQNLMPEKNVALDVAQRVSRRLQDAGLRTVMTRNSDVFVPLSERVAIANAQKRAIFVSIHFNSALRPGACGIETYYGKSASAKQLAAMIQRNCMRTTNGENRGIKTANYFVLRKNRLTAVLVECGVLTNRQDASMAARKEYRESLAAQIANAIIAFR